MPNACYIRAKSVSEMPKNVPHWKKEMKCVVCGWLFEGTMKAVVCGATCRSRLRRIIDRGEQPEFLNEVVKLGQRLPMTLTEKKARKTAKMTPEQRRQEELKKIAHNAEIDRKIAEIRKESLPPGIMPRQHVLNKEIRIDELEKQKILL